MSILGLPLDGDTLLSQLCRLYVCVPLVRLLFILITRNLRRFKHCLSKAYWLMEQTTLRGGFRYAWIWVPTSCNQDSISLLLSAWLSNRGFILRGLFTCSGRISLSAPGFHSSSSLTPAEDLGWSQWPLGGGLGRLGQRNTGAVHVGGGQSWFSQNKIVPLPVEGRRCWAATNS